MNWYEHHIGDYDKNTAHLTACEDGIYSRLLRRYYDKEEPLPADVEKVKRLARARDETERQAVDAVLEEFFHLQEDGWHHDVCDRVIAEYRAGEPEREAKKRNEDTRMARHRAERAELFAVINGAGQHLPWNTKMEELRRIAEQIRNGQPATAPVTAPATGPVTPATRPAMPTAMPPATATATPVTATQPPPTTHQPPPTNIEGDTPLPPKGGGARPRKPPRTPEEDTADLAMFHHHFWPAYPKKADKAAAYRAWRKLRVTPELLAEILAGLELWKRSPMWTKDGGQFRHNPATWLNHRLWEDEEVRRAAEPEERGLVL